MGVQQLALLAGYYRCHNSSSARRIVTTRGANVAGCGQRCTSVVGSPGCGAGHSCRCVQIVRAERPCAICTRSLLVLYLAGMRSSRERRDRISRAASYSKT